MFLRLLPLILSLVLAACEQRVSGNYLYEGSDSASFFQITEAEKGELTGIATVVEVEADGRLTTNKVNLVGVADGDHLTLTIKSGFLGFGDVRLTGTARGNEIELATVGDDARVQTMLLRKSSLNRFERVLAQIRRTSNVRSSEEASRDGAARYSANIERATMASRDAVTAAKAMLALRADLLASTVQFESNYRSIESRMGKLIERERSTDDQIARGQIEVEIGQLEVEGGQVDVAVDRSVFEYILETRNVENQLPDSDSHCPEVGEVVAKGASPQLADQSHSACAALAAVITEVRAAISGAPAVEARLDEMKRKAAARREDFVLEARNLVRR